MGESFISSGKDLTSGGGSFTLLKTIEVSGTVGDETRPYTATVSSIPAILRSESKISIFRFMKITMVAAPIDATISIWDYNASSPFYTGYIDAGTSIYGYFFMPISDSSGTAPISDTTFSKKYKFTYVPDLAMTITLRIQFAIYSYDADLPN